MKRRDLLKTATLLPLSGTLFGSIFASKESFAGSAESPVSGKKRDLLKELGIRTFINAAGTYTTMTASLMHQEVMDAINQSSDSFCMLNEVQDKVGERIAKMVHSESAMVTAGAFSALMLGMAGILTGTDPKKVAQLPHNLEAAGMKSEVLIQKSHHIGYDHALINVGVKLIDVETPEDVRRAINDRTAAMFFMNCNADRGQIQDKEWVSLAREHNLPTLIDIAADVPPVSNLWKFNDLGFSLVAISGGKALRGPQSAGVLMGKKDLIAAARMNNSPNAITIGRGMKVNKEEMLGMYAALDKYVNMDHDKEWKVWEGRINHINNAIKNIAGVKTQIFVPPIANHTPTLQVSWDQDKIRLTGKEFMERLRNGNPSIEVIGNSLGGFNTTVFMLKPGEEKIVARRVREELLAG